MIQTAMRINEDLRDKSLEKLPRGISMSALFRWALHAAVDTQKEFDAYVRSEEEVARVQKFMADRVGRLVCDR